MYINTLCFCIYISYFADFAAAADIDFDFAIPDRPEAECSHHPGFVPDLGSEEIPAYFEAAGHSAAIPDQEYSAAYCLAYSCQAAGKADSAATFAPDTVENYLHMGFAVGKLAVEPGCFLDCHRCRKAYSAVGNSAELVVEENLVEKEWLPDWQQMGCLAVVLKNPALMVVEYYVDHQRQKDYLAAVQRSLEQKPGSR